MKKNPEQTEQLVTDAEILAQETGAIDNAKEALDRRAEDIDSQALALASAQSAIDAGKKEDQFKVPKKDGVLFSEADVLVQMQNAMDAGSEKAARKDGDEPYRPRTLEGAIDEAIENSYEKEQQERLDDYIDTSLENE